MTGMPRVSVVLPAYNSSGTLECSLQGLSAQTFRDFETIVIDSSPDPGPAARIVEQFPGVRLDHHLGRLLPHEAMNLGAERAGGEILVFSAPDCRADPPWLKWLVEAQEQGHAAVGGAVASLPDFRNRAIHLSKYPWWLPGGAPRRIREIASGNSSFSRALWEAVGPYRGDRFAGDCELSWRIRCAGSEIWFEPRATITHLDHGSLPTLLYERYARGLDYGKTRAEFRGFSRLECALRLVSLPMAPLVMVLRAGRFAASSGHLLVWLATLPVQLAAAACWCVGEAPAHARVLWQHSAGS